VTALPSLLDAGESLKEEKIDLENCPLNWKEGINIHGN